MKTELISVTANTQVEVLQDTQYVVKPSSKPYELTFVFTKPGVSAEVICVYKGNLHLTIITVHKVPHTSCRVSVKGVLPDKAESDFIGKIIIEKAAQQTNSFLQHDVLVIGDDVRNNSQPILEIEADDVKASHGATTGRLNQDQVYYLMARGFDSDAAESLLISGFFESLLAKINDRHILSKVRIL